MKAHRPIAVSAPQPNPIRRQAPRDLPGNIPLAVTTDSDFSGVFGDPGDGANQLALNLTALGDECTVRPCIVRLERVRDPATGQEKAYEIIGAGWAIPSAPAARGSTSPASSIA